MDTYKTEMSPHALQMLQSYADYIEETFNSPGTADDLYVDAEQTLDKLSWTAGSYGTLRDKELANLGYRKILFNMMDYLMIYRIVGDTAYVYAVYHQLQDYENLFAEEIGIR